MRQVECGSCQMSCNFEALLLEVNVVVFFCCQAYTVYKGRVIHLILHCHSLNTEVDTVIGTSSVEMHSL